MLNHQIWLNNLEQITCWIFIYPYFIYPYTTWVQRLGSEMKWKKIWILIIIVVLKNFTREKQFTLPIVAFHQTAKSRENCHSYFYCQGSCQTDKNCLATIKISKVAIAIGYLFWKQHYVCNLNTVTQLLKCFK